MWFRPGVARLLLFGGKGGVGKTTTACATAVWLAKSGFRTLVVSSDPAHSTGDSFEQELGGEPTKIKGFEQLWGLELDPERRMQDLMPKMSEAFGGGVSNQLSAIMGGGTEDLEQEVSGLKAGELMFPGLDEGLAFDQLLRHVEDPRFDVVVFDTAPTGHTLRFLALPEILDSWTDRLLRMMRMSGGIRSLLFCRKQEEEMRDELERLKRRISHVRRVLASESHATFMLVTIAEQMAVEESKRAAQALDEFGIHLGGLIINRITPDLDHDFLQSRRKMELKHIHRLMGIFRETALAQIPLEMEDIHGTAALEKIGTCLHGPASDPPHSMDPVMRGTQIPLQLRRGLVQKLSNEGDLRVQIHLPSAKKEEVGLRGEGSKLFVSVNGVEAEIDVGRPAKVDGIVATFSDEILTLTLPPSTPTNS